MVDVSDPSGSGPPVSDGPGGYAPTSGIGPERDPYGDYSMETPFDCFKRPDVLEQLRNHPTTRPYSLDSGFLKQVERMAAANTQQEQGSVCMADPRLMQAMAALQGWGLSCTEKEVKHAESVGDAPKRDAVQLPHYQYAFQYATPREAKDEGNRLFKEGDYPKALACWARVRYLYQQMAQAKTEEERAACAFPPPEESLAANLANNCAAALLKLERPDEALKELEEAIRTSQGMRGGSTFDLSKVHYRQAQAYEMLARRLVNVEAAAAEWTKALDAARAAVTAAKEADARQADAGIVRTGPSGTVTHLQRELKRYKEMEREAREKVEKAKAQELRDKEAERRRAKGLQQEVVSEPERRKDGQIIPNPSRPTVGYVRDIDLSVFATSWLQRELVKVEHTWADGSVKADQLDTRQSEIHASIKEKRGKRALYYDLTLVFNWSGKSRLGRGKGNYGEMQGIMKMYNIGQDTKFELGGDKETSYMYELGFHPMYHGDCDPWATQVKSECAELFEMVSTLILKKLVPAVEAKGELVK
jgi:tetratricopeptide (TPR) repeat protein